ncbi:UNVERIFIED_CONTAM: Zinc finger protein ZPR1 [Sesamum radiatum]|uniref:Zinc finger protein ZPR1 n=1 Tax=Sesamum radiatum TaxID=300843 RepID=A0AAW2T301_SESRA
METKTTTQGAPQIVDVGSVVEAVSAEDSDAPLYEVESLCMRCGENFVGEDSDNVHDPSLLLFQYLSYYVLGDNSVFVNSNSTFQKGTMKSNLLVKSNLKAVTTSWKFHQVIKRLSSKELDVMFNRQVVKSETATIKIPELDFEIPPEAQRGSLSTKVDPQIAEAIDEFLVKLRACATGQSQFTFILDDPAGNSFIENPYAPSPDPSLTIKFYERTPEQHAALGYLVDTSQGEPAAENIPQRQEEPHGSVGARAGRRAIVQGNSTEIADALFRYSAPEEVMTFPSTCGACATKCECRMFVTNIPYFQEVIVMASTCDACGYRNSEVKPGGRIPDKGKRIIVHVKNIKDLSRDVIKSDTASVKIPELELELASGTLGGLVTTVEGLISKIGESLERVHGFTFGDSLDDNRRSKWKEFRAKLEKLKSLEESWSLIIDDALANSFVAPATDEIKDDTQLTFEEYERSWEQNEELGLNDMDTSAADVAYTCANEKND